MRQSYRAFSTIVAASIALVAIAALASNLPNSAAAQTPARADAGAASLDVALPEGLEEPIPEAAPGAPSRNLLQIIYAGGPMMVPIIGCSFLLCVFVFERVIMLRRGRVIPRPFVKRFLEQLREGQLDQESALELCQENKSPISTIFAGALRRWGKPAVEVEQAILDEGERVANGLRRYLRLFNGISTLTPLLGLLGTVYGMIHSFNSIASASGMGKPELLAAGIGEALITTAGGLTVAIPALIAYLFFVGKVDGMVVELDSLGQEVVGIIASDGWEKVSTEKSKRRSKAAA
ncbi:MAG TPA: MotA/TolQ/ExbB proton channel family protein [Pirellulaceae bacterium]|jgi:biopolymer transport protein ExbB|nr:MotA/TolQ/ExbB proton channel family protein [Pirellulaceae bacterium]